MEDLNQLEVQTSNVWDAVSTPVELQWWETQQVPSIQQTSQPTESQKVVYTKASEITDYSIPSLGNQAAMVSGGWAAQSAHIATMAAKKARLIQLLRNQLQKWKKIWFIRGALSWILIMVCIVTALVVFAKDTVLDMLSDNLNNLDTQASITNLTTHEDNNENISDIAVEVIDETSDEANDDVVVEIDDENNDEANDDIVVEIDETSDEANDDIVVEIDETSDEINDDIVVEIDETSDENNDEANDDIVVEIDDDIIYGDWYILRHVDTPEDANWVINPNCKWLSCEEIDLSSIVLCHEFRLKADMDDNAQRIWKSWVCRYKDASELVNIEIQ